MAYLTWVFKWKYNYSHYLFVYIYSSASEITFEDTKVPIENVIGEIGDGFKVSHVQPQIWCFKYDDVMLILASFF